MRKVLIKLLAFLLCALLISGGVAACGSNGEGDRAEGPPADIVFGDIDADIGDLLDLGGMSWLVLDVHDGKALLIGEYVLDQQAYHPVRDDITWEESRIRQYLNEEFYNSTFTETEKARIIETRNPNNDNTDYGTSGGNETSDLVFLLSTEEAQLYFTDSESRIGYTPDGVPKWWWLRTPGMYSVSASCVFGDGNILHLGNFVSYSLGIRPALWIYL